MKASVKAQAPPPAWPPPWAGRRSTVWPWLRGRPRRGPSSPTPAWPSIRSSTTCWSATTSWPPRWPRPSSARVSPRRPPSRVPTWSACAMCAPSTTSNRRPPSGARPGGWSPGRSSRRTRGRASSTSPPPSARWTARWARNTACPPSTRWGRTAASPVRWRGWRGSRCGPPTAGSTTAWRQPACWCAATLTRTPTRTAGGAAPPSSTGASRAGTSGRPPARTIWSPRTRRWAGTPSTSGTAAWGSGWPTTWTGPCRGTGSGGRRCRCGGAGPATPCVPGRWPSSRRWPAGT